MQGIIKKAGVREYVANHEAPGSNIGADIYDALDDKASARSGAGPCPGK
jgi:hypothetical protein